jgi:retron-type reverse transcriptase
MQEQISAFMTRHLSPFFCGYRKGFSAQHALISLLEKWKTILDKNGYAGAILMDLSKAFDCMNHDLLIAKLYAYGFSKNAVAMIRSYLKNRWQRTKINTSFSSWSELLTGVPQGSVLGPLLFNIYMTFSGRMNLQMFVILLMTLHFTLVTKNLILY